MSTQEVEDGRSKNEDSADTPVVSTRTAGLVLSQSFPFPNSAETALHFREMAPPGDASWALPPQSAFLYAILCHLSKCADGDRREAIHVAVAELLKLSEGQRNDRLANLPHMRHFYRSGYGLSILKKTGYVESPARGYWRITEVGRKRIADETDREILGRQILREYRSGQREREGTKSEVDDSSPQLAEQTPEERIDAAMEEIHDTVAADLLERILRAPPVFFEDLVLTLLHAMGYGASSEQCLRVGGPGDEGFDGIISLDRLGFEKVYVQAKRWQGAIGRPELQSFFGALQGRRARKGVFITTSNFTREARDFGHKRGEVLSLLEKETGCILVAGKTTKETPWPREYPHRCRRTSRFVNFFPAAPAATFARS